MRIVFFGTPEFAAYSLQKIVEANYNVVCVVTATDKPAGRGNKITESEVKKTAIALNLPVLQPPNLKSAVFYEELQAYQPDLGIVIAFRMMPAIIWGLPKQGTFNLHASLLPKYRGAAPINHAIINGEQITGNTTFFLKHEIDTGDIILQHEIPILPEDNFGTMYEKLKINGADLVIQSLEKIASENISLTPQKEIVHAPTAPKIFRENCELFPSLTCKETHNKIRGLNPIPGAWVKINSSTFKIFETAFSPQEKNENRIFVSNKKLYVTCADGCLEITLIQAENKPKMDALAFINGRFLEHAY